MPRYKIVVETDAVLTIPELMFLAKDVEFLIEDAKDTDAVVTAQYD